MLSNGGFEVWAGGSPSSWTREGNGAWQQESVDVVSGLALKVIRSGPSATNATHQPMIEVEAGATLSGRVSARGGPLVSVDFRFFNEAFQPLLPVSGNGTVTSSMFSTVTHEMVVTDPAARYMRFTVRATGTGDLILDEASLDIVSAPPTATPPPTETPTQTATPTETPELTATVAGSHTATPTTSGTSATATATPTPTPTRTPTGTRTPSPTREPTSTKTPVPPKSGAPTAPLPTSTPKLPTGSGTGGFLANGDFELVAEGKPAHWQKFGGEMVSSPEAARGSFAGCLESTTPSTKWLYQIVSVEGGGWYAAGASARMSGPGEASIRISWYESGDGSGTQIEPFESPGTTAPSWTLLSTGPVQAPDEARSARVRLTLQPGVTATACFDDATFFEAPAPSATPVPTGEPGPGTPTPTRTAPSGAAPPGQNSPAQRIANLPNAGAVVAIGPATIRISEIMSDPTQPGRDATYEWVEIVNIGNEPIDLAGWRLADGTSGEVLPAMPMSAGSYIVIAGRNAELPAGVPAIRLPGGEIGNGLGNDGDVVRLLAPDGALVDEVSYGDNVKVFDPAPAPPSAGETLGVRDPAGDPASENWAITLRPTPGEPNLFPPKAVSTVAGARHAQPSESTEASDGDGDTVEVDDDDAGSGAGGWIVLGGLAGLSVGVAGAALGPRARKWWVRFRSR